MARKTKDGEESKAKIELAKLKGMSFRDKAGYILDYYKLHLIIAAIVVFMIGYFIHSALNPAPKTYLEMAIMDASTTMDDRDVITNALNAALIPADEAGKYVFQIDDFYMAPDDASDYAQALSQKFSAMLFARQINLMMFGDASLEGLGEEGLYTDLSTIFDESELSAHEDQVVRKEFPSDNDMTGQTANGMYPCALKLAGSEFFTSLGFDVSNMYLAVYYTGQSDDAMKQAIEYIMGW